YHYNALQKLTYFAVIFIMAPLAMLTGLGMAPAIVNRFPWYPKLFGNRQGARSIHFLVLIAYLLFIVGHVALVIATEVVRNLNYITLGIQSHTNLTGVYITIGIVLFTVGCWVLAHWL